MATFFGESVPHGDKPGIVDDFMFGSNVAGSHKYIRLGFLRKVYGILSVQLLCTTLVSALFMVVEPIRDFVQTSQTLLTISALASIVLIFALMIKSREVPTNFILLACFTLCESILVGTVVTFYKVSSVLEAFGLTCAVTAALTVYTFQSNRDFSSWGAGLFAALWVLLLAGFLQMFIGGEMLDRGLAAAGAVLFSLYIIYDTHMIMHRVSPEEYVHGAVALYLDIINLFLHLLKLFGERK